MDKQKIIHGTALEIFGDGIIITGKSGIGKSELALKLIDRGHKFIADDQIIVTTDQNHNLWISPPPSQFIHIGGIGFIDVTATYGIHAALTSPVRCNLVVKLETGSLDPNTRVSELSSSITIFKRPITLANLYTAHNRPLELLVEILVKKQQQLSNGYNANKAFMDNMKTV